MLRYGYNSILYFTLRSQLTIIVRQVNRYALFIIIIIIFIIRTSPAQSSLGSYCILFQYYHY